MTANILLWALGTGGMTGAVWMGIVLLSRQRRLAAEHRDLLEDRQRVLDELEVLSDRVTEMQDRLDFAERLLAGADSRQVHPAQPPDREEEKPAEHDD